MRKMIVGLTFTILGMASMLIQIVSAIPFVFELRQWSGSRLWYIILGQEHFNLGILFYTSAALFLLGVVISLVSLIHDKR